MPSANPTEFFIDRSLGKYVVAEALRGAGATVHTMAEVYGERVGQGLADVDWLDDAGTHGWVVLMKDDRIRRRPAELNALIEAGVRAFCLTNANLRGAEMAERFVTRLSRIEQLAESRPGPYIFGVYADGVRPLWPKDPDA